MWREGLPSAGSHMLLSTEFFFLFLSQAKHPPPLALLWRIDLYHAHADCRGHESDAWRKRWLRASIAKHVFFFRRIFSSLFHLTRWLISAIDLFGEVGGNKLAPCIANKRKWTTSFFVVDDSVLERDCLKPLDLKAKMPLSPLYVRFPRQVGLSIPLSVWG